MKMQLSCGCCDSREFCQRNYNPKTGDCSWSVRVLGDHTPEVQPDRLDFEAGGLPIAGTNYPWGVQPFNAGGTFVGREHTGIDLTPVTDSFDVTLPIGFGNGDTGNCLKTISKSVQKSTGLIADPKGSSPPPGYTINWANVSMAQVRYRYDSFQNVSVPTGAAGTGGAYTVQLFKNSAAGLIQTDPFAAQMSWGQFDRWASPGAQSFEGEELDAAGGANNYHQFNTALRIAAILDPTSIEYFQNLTSTQQVQFQNGVVTANYSGTSNAGARGTRYIYDGGLLDVQSAAQGTFTGPLGTTVAKLFSHSGSNTLVGNTHDGRQIYLHPLLTALGIPITSPIMPTFAVKTFVRPTVEGLYTFANLDGDPEPDGWVGTGSYGTTDYNGLLYMVGTVDQPWTFDRTQMTPNVALSPAFGTVPLDPSEWGGEPDDAAKWKKREGFSFDIDSEDTDDVLTVTRNDCPIPPDPDPVDPEEETAP